ncbi:MAG: MoeA C-terminal region [Frankiales bacterium]|nr:MoeA C-terminal region [Frankiales bacterium]
MLRALAGDDPGTAPMLAVLGLDVVPLPHRQRYVRARRTRPADGGVAGGGVMVAVPIDGYGSHLVGGLGDTDCFVELPPGTDPHLAGTVVRILPLEGA